MKLIDIVDNISDVLVRYYLYHCTIDNASFQYDDIICHLSNHILQYFASHEDPDAEIHSVYVLFGIDERSYIGSELNKETWELILNHIMSSITNGLYIHHSDPIISINVVPFDGVLITKHMILSILDKYFYK